MNWNVIRLEDVVATPWRNGGGITRELAAWPTRSDWSWRMSVAEVEQSGPFSRFAGVERWFSVLQGEGVHLEVDGVAHTVTTASVPFKFDGEAHTECTLVHGPTRDFNLMVRSGKAQAQMERIEGIVGVSLNAPKIVAVYAMDAGATLVFGPSRRELPPHTLAWRSVPPFAHVQVESAQALWMEIAV